MYKEFGEFKGKLNANGIRFSILKNNQINLTDKLDLSSFAIDKFFDIMYQSSALIKSYLEEKLIW